MRHLVISFFMAVGAPLAVLAEETKGIYLVDNEGTELQVASITLPAEGKTRAYSVDWNDDLFEDYFLSMRPFKCLTNQKKVWCRVPYPYEIKQEITENDLVSLEYDLLFVWKKANEYGINLWNGVYYRLEAEGEQFLGTMHDIDLEKLGVPPEKGNLRPIEEADILESDAESHWLPRVIIR